MVNEETSALLSSRQYVSSLFYSVNNSDTNLERRTMTKGGFDTIYSNPYSGTAVTQVLYSLNGFKIPMTLQTKKLSPQST